MELLATSDYIELTLSTDDGATPPKIIFTDKLYTDPAKRRMFALQVIDDNKIKLYRNTDNKGVSQSWLNKNFRLTSAPGLAKDSADIDIVNSYTSNKTGTIITQSDPTFLWIYIEIDWANQTLIRELNLQNPGDGSYIVSFTRYDNDLYYIVENADTSWTLHYLNLKTFSKKGTVINPTWSMAVVTDNTCITSSKNYLYVYILDTTFKIKVYNAGTQTLAHTWTDVTPGETSSYPVFLSPINDLDIFLRHPANSLFRITDGVATRLNTDFASDTNNFLISSKGTTYVEATDRTFTTKTYAKWKNRWYIDNVVSSVSQNLFDLIAYHCSLVNLSKDDYAIASSLLNIDVRGWLISQVAPEKNNLDILRVAYNVDMPTLCGKLYFVQRGEMIADPLAEAEIGTYEGALRYQDKGQFEKARALDLPSKTTVKYKQADYYAEIGSQSIQQVLAEHENEEVIDFSNSLSLIADEAKQLVDIIRKQRIAEGNSFVFTSGWERSDIAPGDIIEITLDGSTFNVYVIEQNFNNWIFTNQCYITEVFNYSSDYEGAQNSNPEPEIIENIEVYQYLLDIPGLTADVDFGFFVAIARQDLNQIFVSTELWRSTNQIAWTDLLKLTQEATIGYAVTALASATWTIPDYFSTVTVQLLDTDKTLSSVTEEQAKTGMYNVALLGNEIIIYQDATPTANPGEYTLETMLIRGFRETKDGIDTHESGERFIVLDDSVIQYTDLIAFLNSTLYYVCNISNPIEPDEVQTFQNTGRILKPFPPVRFEAYKDSGNVIISWERQDRSPSARDCWYTYCDTLILSEEIEKYELDIYDGSQVIRTISTTATSYNYSSSQQNADFGSSISNLKAAVYQISAKIGRGLASVLEVTFAS